MIREDLKSLILTGVPEVEHTLLDGRHVKLRAMLVKELKLLMLAKEGGSEEKMVIQVLEQCMVTKGIDVENLPSFEIEMLYLKLFTASRGSAISNVSFICQNEVEGKTCGHKIKTRINLNSVTFDKELNKDNDIEINEKMRIFMRYPTAIEQEYFSLLKDEADGVKRLINLALNCVSKLEAGGQTLVVGEDITKEELTELMELATEQVFEKMIKYIETVPTLSYSMPLKCPKCGYEDIVTLKGLADFFD